jgi:hypothetical protein
MKKRKKIEKKPKKTRQKAKPFRRARLTAKLLAGKRTKKKILRKKKIVKKKKLIKRKKKSVRKTRSKRKVLKRAKKKVKPRKKIKIKKIKIKKKRIRKGIKPKKKARKKVKPRKKIIKKRPKKTRQKAKPLRRARLTAKLLAGKRKRVRPRKRKPRKKIVKPRVYVGKGILDQLFESQAKVKLLRFFFRNTEEMFQPKDIFRRLRSNTSLLRQEAKKLEKIGVIKQKRTWLSFERKRGGTKKEKRTVWYLNPRFDFLKELQNLILKSAISSKDELVDNIRKVGSIKLLVLAGVFTGDDKSKADLLIVGDKIDQRKLNAFIKDLEGEVGKDLNCVIMSAKEFNYRYDMYDRFVRDLLTDKSDILIKKVKLW